MSKLHIVPVLFISIVLNSLLIPVIARAADVNASDQLLKASQENPATAAATAQYQDSEYKQVLESLQKGLAPSPADTAAAAPAADQPSRFEAIANSAPKSRVRANPYEVRNDLGSAPVKRKVTPASAPRAAVRSFND